MYDKGDQNIQYKIDSLYKNEIRTFPNSLHETKLEMD